VSDRPNILFLFSDQHNARCLSCADHPEVQTPHLDRLAAEGVRFGNAYTQNPICTPSRMSFLASLYPSTHGYYGLYGREPQESMTHLLGWCRARGYRTGALGKLHTPRYWVERECQYVYDEFLEYPTYLEGAGLYAENDARNFNNRRDGEASRLPLEHSCEVALARQTLRFIRNEGEPKDRGPDEAPWCAWVSFSRPHQPWTPSEPYASMYPPESLSLPPNAAPEVAGMHPSGGYPEEPRLRQLLAAYLGLVSQTDHAIGLILEELEARGELERTVIVYSADHGDYAGEHHRVEKHSGISHRAITRIPLIVRYPQTVAQGEVCDAMAEAVDVFPTLCDLAGLETPRSAQGRSLLPLLGGDPQPVREDCLTEGPYRKALATPQWRYVANIDGQPDELYDQQDDPWETRNRIDDPACAEVAARLQRRLLDRLARARRPVTVLNGGWHNHAYDEDGRLDLAGCGGTNLRW
jgi:choline-sulfatase/uncharacterized sulfatase